MARPRKDESVKAAQGTLQPCRRHRQIDMTAATLTTEPPVGLTKDARAAWQLAVECAPEGVLTALDAGVLERWARNYALYRKLAKLVEKGDIVFMKDGEPTPNLSPAFNALVKVQQILAKCETELGFTPSSRARVSVRKKDDDQGNEFGDF